VGENPTRAVAVQSSSIAGKGVIAKGPFRRGEIILEIDDSRIVDQAHPLGPHDDARHCDYLAAEKVILMQAPERYINHSCDPNTYVKTVDGKRVVVALRAIAEREEITYDYCINGGGDTVWTCRCGAPRCRREIHSDFFHLPIELQREYLPLLDTWFREERADEVQHLQNRQNRTC
jgi:SET domain-containing protein